MTQYRCSDCGVVYGTWLPKCGRCRGQNLIQEKRTVPKISRQDGVTDKSQYPEAFDPELSHQMEEFTTDDGTLPSDPNAVQVRDPDRDHSPEHTRSADLRYQADGTFSEAGSSDVTGEPLGEQDVEYPEGYGPEEEPDTTELPKSDAKKAEWRAYLDQNAADEYDPEELDAMTRDELAQAARDWKQGYDEDRQAELDAAEAAGDNEGVEDDEESEGEQPEDER